MSWLFSALAFAGGILNIKQFPVGFACWAVSNTYFGLTAIDGARYPEATTFAVNLVLSIYGYIAWRRARL